MHFFSPVFGWQCDSPDVHGSFEFDAVMGRVAGLDIYNARRALFPRQIDVNHDAHARGERMRARDESTVEIDDDSFTLAGEGIAGTEDLDGDLKRDTSTATMFEKWLIGRHWWIDSEIVHLRWRFAGGKRGEVTVK